MTEVLCLDMQYTTPQTPGGACWVGRKSWWTTSAQCYSKVPNPKGVRKLEGTQSFIVILPLLQREGWARAARVGEKSRWICTSKFWNVDEFSGIQVASFPKKSPQVWKANNSRGIQFSNYPPANKAVQRSCLSPRRPFQRSLDIPFADLFASRASAMEKRTSPVSLML